MITEWRIQKRVEEQFNAFISGFSELIPADLVNVFDERELELLIGGIADIDVDDWKKHTDYRGYTENDDVIVHFWNVSLSPHTLRPKREEQSTDKESRSSELGTLNRSRVYYSSLPVPLEFPSTGLRICKVVMGPEGLPSRSLEIQLNYQSHIPGMLFS